MLVFEELCLEMLVDIASHVSRQNAMKKLYALTIIA